MKKYLIRTLGNWKVLLMGLFINMVSITVAALLLPGIDIVERRLITFVLLGVTLGVLNTVIKPLLQLLTIRLLFITYGINIIIINTIMLLLLDWIFGDAFQVTGLLTAILGAILIWSLSTFLDYVLGVLPPLGYMQALREEEAEA
jgi:putative membrane protein